MTVECVFRKKFRCIILGIILIFWAVIMCKASAKAQETVIEAGGMCPLPRAVIARGAAIRPPIIA